MVKYELKLPSAGQYYDDFDLEKDSFLLV